MTLLELSFPVCLSHRQATLALALRFGRRNPTFHASTVTLRKYLKAQEDLEAVHSSSQVELREGLGEQQALR